MQSLVGAFVKARQREGIRDNLLEARSLAHQDSDIRTMSKIADTLESIGYFRESSLTNLAIQAMQQDGTVKTALYRHYDARGQLLYVGISLSAVARLSEHRGAEWFDDIASVKVEYFPSRQQASTAERAAIKSEHPRYNKTHNDRLAWLLCRN